MKKTLRLTFPEWQGGVNPNYYMGSRLLTWLAPEGKNCESAEVPVETDFGAEVPIIGGICARDVLMRQQQAAMAILEEKQPDKVIVLGGDCSVNQAPFDYLHGKYPEDTGILWIDAHPDFSEPGDGTHEHAMVLGNLLGGGVPEMAAMVKHPFQAADVMYAGLVADELEKHEKEHMKKYRIAYATPEDLADHNEKVLAWIKEKGFKHMLIHWDLDVMSPKDFYSLLCNEPHIPPVEYAVGRMTLEQITGLIQEVSAVTEVVGLGITEYMPWDVIRFRKALSRIDIFKE